MFHLTVENTDLVGADYIAKKYLPKLKKVWIKLNIYLACFQKFLSASWDFFSRRTKRSNYSAFGNDADAVKWESCVF